MLLPSLVLVLSTSNGLAAEPTPPSGSGAIHVDLRASAGASQSTDRDTAVLLGAHVLARKNWLALGLAGEVAGYIVGNVRTAIAGAAGVTLENAYFRVTGLGLVGMHRWTSPHAQRIGHDRTESTAFLGLRTDLEVRALTVGRLELTVGLWVSATVDLHRERIHVINITSDPDWFIKGETAGAAGLSLGATF